MKRVVFSKRRRQGLVRRGMVYLVIGALLLPYAAVRTAVPAQAQVRVKPVAVLDFENRSGYGGALLGQTAAAAVALELPPYGYDVEDQREVMTEIAALRLYPPYDPRDLQTLGRNLDVNEIFEGRVLTVETRETRPMRARVVLSVRVYDVETAELVNGSVAEGVAEPRDYTGSLDVLLNQALERAAKQAVQEIHANQPIRGAVLMVDELRQEVLINIGRLNGISVGDELVVLRNIFDREKNVLLPNQRIGRLKVIKASQSDSECAIQEQVLGVKTNDKVMKVFKMPSEPLAAGGFRALRRKPTTLGKRLTSFILPVASLLLVGTIANKRGTKAPGIGEAFLYQERPGQDPVIRITWKRDWTPHITRIFGWCIYRANFANFPTVPGNNPPSGPGLIEVLDDHNATSYDDTNQDYVRQDVTITVTYLDEAGDEETSDYTATYNHPAVVPGETYYYKVRRINPPTTFPTVVGGTGSRQVTWVDPTEDDADGVRSDPSRPIGPVTYIQPPVLDPLGSGDQSPTSIEFSWDAAPGATEYVLEIHARDPLLGGAPLFRSQPITRSSGQGKISYRYDIKQPGFVALQPDTDYYWRVGARNGHPREVRPRSPMANSNGYIFTEGLRFHTASEPPWPPGT